MSAPPTPVATDPVPSWRNGTLLLMGAFGFFAGLPLPLSGFTLRQWLSEGGVALTAIGLTANIGLAYTLKFLWSPLLDQLAPPFRRFGRRRGWLLTIQPLLALATVALATADPVHAPLRLIGAALAIAFLSSCQDIVIDAWRIEVFPERAQGLALASYIWGYRIALLVAGAGAIGLVNVLGWHGTLLALAGLILTSIVVTFAAPEPTWRAQSIAATLSARLRAAIVEPFADFWRRPASGRILAFVMLFKLGEALAHTMAVPFYNSLGFDRAQIALATGIPSLIANLAGAMVGGWLIIRIGTGRALILTGFVQMASMTMYFALAVSGGETHILLAKIVLESFAEAMADAAFLTFLSSLCSSAFTATQYALLSSLAAVGLRTIGGLSGIFAAALGWEWFYAMTIIAALPAMLLMLTLVRRPPAPDP